MLTHDPVGIRQDHVAIGPPYSVYRHRVLGHALRVCPRAEIETFADDWVHPFPRVRRVNSKVGPSQPGELAMIR
jgi:hypothetical protein